MREKAESWNKHFARLAAADDPPEAVELILAVCKLMKGVGRIL